MNIINLIKKETKKVTLFVILFSEPNNHYFNRAAEAQLTKSNRRNHVIVLRTAVKCHKALGPRNESDVLEKCCSEKIHKFNRKETLMKSFLNEVATLMKKNSIISLFL